MSSALVTQLAALALTLTAAGIVTAGACFAVFGEDSATFDPGARERMATHLPPPRENLATPIPRRPSANGRPTAIDWRVDTGDLDAWRADPLASTPDTTGSLISSGIRVPTLGKVSRWS